MNSLAILTIALSLLGYGLMSRRLKGSMLSGPMLFVALGFVAGPSVLNLVPMEISNSALHLLAEITLILVLFSDAASIDLRQLRRDHNLPVRMLLIGMPMTILSGTAIALAMFSEFSIWEAALLAAILAPTDAALGMAVVTDPRVPVRIRQALNVESGLNDGIALPFVLLFASLAAFGAGPDEVQMWLAIGGKQLVLGPVAGVVIGVIGGKLCTYCYRTNRMSENAEGLVGLAMAFSAFALAESIGGNGFIGAFVGGLTFGNTLQRKCKFLYEFTEAEGQILVLFTFLAFGTAMLPDAIFGTGYLVYAVVALTLLRMVPVYISLIGTGTQPVTSLFLGWFGPRGLASVLFVLLILEESNVPHRAEIATIVTIAVLLSVFLHGISAGPAARRYGARASGMGECAENMPVSEEPFH